MTHFPFASCLWCLLENLSGALRGWDVRGCWGLTGRTSPGPVLGYDTQFSLDVLPEVHSPKPVSFLTQDTWVSSSTVISSLWIIVTAFEDGTSTQNLSGPLFSSHRICINWGSQRRRDAPKGVQLKESVQERDQGWNIRNMNKWRIRRQDKPRWRVRHVQGKASLRKDGKAAEEGFTHSPLTCQYVPEYLEHLVGFAAMQTAGKAKFPACEQVSLIAKPPWEL